MHSVVATDPSILSIIVLLAGLASVGTWAARWSDSALLGMVVASLVFIAGFFPVGRRHHR